MIYRLKSIEENRVTFDVHYSIRNRKTKHDEICKALRKNDIPFDMTDLREIFRTYEKQNEVDYFINKDAAKFLKEQFDLWLKSYILDVESVFNEERL